MVEDKTLKDTEEMKGPEAETSENPYAQTDSERTPVSAEQTENAAPEPGEAQPSREQPDTSLYDRLYAEVSGYESDPRPEYYEENTDAGRKTETGSGDTAPDPEKTKTGSADGSETNAGRAETGTGQTEKTAEAASEPEKRTADPEPEPAGNASGARTEQKHGNRFFQFFTGEAKYSREQAVLSRIDNEHLMDYLLLEQKRYESEQKHRDERGKRILSAFQLAVSLAAIVAVIGFLKDEPTVLVNILYIIGIVAAIWLWKVKK